MADEHDWSLTPFRDEGKRLDDVILRKAGWFHAEMMSDSNLWMAFYPIDAPQERFSFDVYAKKGPLKFTVSEWARGTYSPGSVTPEMDYDY